jgi:hypothetical protein
VDNATTTALTAQRHRQIAYPAAGFIVTTIPLHVTVKPDILMTDSMQIVKFALHPVKLV